MGEGKVDIYEVSLEETLDLLQAEFLTPRDPNWQFITRRFQNQRLHTDVHQLKGFLAERYFYQCLKEINNSNPRLYIDTGVAPDCTDDRYLITRTGMSVEIIDMHRRTRYELDGLFKVNGIVICAEVKTGICCNLARALPDMNARARLVKKLFNTPAEACEIPWILMLPKNQYRNSENVPFLREWQSKTRIIVPLYSDRMRFEEDVRRECARQGPLLPLKDKAEDCAEEYF